MSFQWLECKIVAKQYFLLSFICRLACIACYKWLSCVLKAQHALICIAILMQSVLHSNISGCLHNTEHTVDYMPPLELLKDPEF